MGRQIDSFYLCDNANVIIMFKQDDLNMRHIYRDHVNTDMSYDSFMKICQKC